MRMSSSGTHRVSPSASVTRAPGLKPSTLPSAITRTGSFCIEAKMGLLRTATSETLPCGRTPALVRCEALDSCWRRRSATIDMIVTSLDVVKLAQWKLGLCAVAHGDHKRGREGIL